MNAVEAALAALEHLSAGEQLAAVAHRLAGRAHGSLRDLDTGTELAPDPRRLDGRALEAIAARALAGTRGAVFTPPGEAAMLAVLALARVAVRRGAGERDALRALAGLEANAAPVARALDGARVLDPCCGGGALLVAALAAARRCGARIAVIGRDVAPVAAEATRLRLAALGVEADVGSADALAGPWPAADAVLMNPPFVRHEALAAADKARASARSGLGRQADLSAHLVAMALDHAPDAGLVWPRALDTARSAEPLRDAARARGGFAYRLRCRSAGSFAASVDTALAVWSQGHAGRPEIETAAPLARLSGAELVALATRVASRRRSVPGPRRAGATLADACAVRFGMKSGCNAFFHLRSLGDGAFESDVAGEVRLAPSDAQPVLTSLKDARAPGRAEPRRHLFRPVGNTPTARRYIAAGELAGVARRPTCAGRSPWWTVAPGRAPAPVLYPAKIGARAFAVVNAAGWWEDKKWHAVFPREGVEPWLVAAVLSATPVRLAIDLAARQLTGCQAIADVDCRVLAAAPFPAGEALPSLRRSIARCWEALARDPVTTDVAAMLARPAQEELDLAVGEALGLAGAEVVAARTRMTARVGQRLEHAAHVRAVLAAAGA